MIDYQQIMSEWKNAELRAIRTGIGEGLVTIGEIYDDVVVLTADLAASVKVEKFRDLYPERFFDVGIAEQNMIGVAAGLANEGFVPFAASYATFSPGRSFEQIRVSVCLSKNNVKVIGSHAGVSCGVNGPSHQATEDIALMRTLPNMVVLAPCDANQAIECIKASYLYPGPVYIRGCRPDTPVFTTRQDFKIGKANVYRTGKNLTICASGIQVYDSLVVAEELAKENIDIEVINVSSIKPMDEATILASVKKTGKLVTIEDHQIAGGMGGAIAELLSSKYPAPVIRVGLNDIFGYSGEYKAIYKKVGLDSESLKATCLAAFKM